MYDRLVHRSPEVCVRIGRRVRVRLEADPRLGDAASDFGAAQDSFEARFLAWSEAVETARAEAAFLAEAVRGLEGAFRLFGAWVLALGRNNRKADRYLQFYPEGYGRATRLVPPAQLHFAGVLLAKLAEETEPQLVFLRNMIEAARGMAGRSVESHAVAVQLRKEEFGCLQAERRTWARAMQRAQHRAWMAIPDQPADVRRAFAAARARRQEIEAEEEAEEAAGPEGAGTVEQVEGGRGGLALLPATPVPPALVAAS
jgi:hypothetical protein